MNDKDYRLAPSGYVMKDAINGSKIVGRISGYGEGTWWYQIARQPYDERAVMGFKDEEAAFKAMVGELHRRSNQETIQEARAS